MATKQFMTLENLSTYHNLITQYIDEADADSIKSLSVSGNTVSFYRSSDATGTVAYEVTLPDVSGFMSKISSATGGKIVTSTATGEVSESGTAISDLATNAFVGSLPAGAAATTVVGYIDEAVADATDDKMDKITSAEGDKVVVSNSDGSVSESQVSISDVSDSIAATTGFDGDNTIADFIGEIPQGSSATDVIGYVDEQVDAVEDVADEKTVYIVDNGATSAYAKVYSIYQGSAGSAASPVAGEKLIDINIPKDQVVESGSVADITFHDSKLWDGATDVTTLIKGTGTPTAADAGKYIKLVLQNVTDPLYIAAQSLVDIYTAQPNATSVQLTISNTNEISAVIVDGAVTTAKIADDAVTAAKVAIAAHTESQTAGSDGIAISVTTTDGQVSSVSASIASNTYASAAQGALADTALQPEDVGEISTSDIESLFE